MINGGNATIYVTDMDRAVSFYTDALGLRLEFRAGDHWASIDAGSGLTIGLHPASSRGPVPGQTGSITVGMSVDQPIEQVMASLTAHGVTFDGPVRDEGMLKLAFFSDPDGNALYLAETGTSGQEF